MATADNSHLRRLGSQFGEYVSRQKGNVPSPAALQGVIADLAAGESELIAPLRDLVSKQSFAALLPYARSNGGLIQRDALIQEISRVYHPDVLVRVEEVLNGFLDASGGIATSLMQDQSPVQPEKAVITNEVPPLDRMISEKVKHITSGHQIYPVATMHMDRASGNNVSEAMKLRLNAIDEHLSYGYTLQKDFGAFPILIGSDNRRHNIYITENPAGFSWIAFFFPFAVCTQIREWSYFYVSSILGIIAALIADSTGYDPSTGASIALSLMYGVYFPYLRHMARVKNVREVSRGMSVIIGLLLCVLASVPSYVIEIIADYAKN